MMTNDKVPQGSAQPLDEVQKAERLVDAIELFVSACEDGRSSGSERRAAMESAAQVVSLAIEENWPSDQAASRVVGHLEDPALGKYQGDLLRLVFKSRPEELPPLAERAFHALGKRSGRRDRDRTLRRLVYLSGLGVLSAPERSRLLDQVLSLGNKAPSGLAKVVARAMAEGGWGGEALDRLAKASKTSSLAASIVAEGAERGVDVLALRSFLEAERRWNTLLFYELHHGTTEGVVRYAERAINTRGVAAVRHLVPPADPERAVVALCEFLRSTDVAIQLEACVGLAELAKRGFDTSPAVEPLSHASYINRYVPSASSTVSKQAVRALALLGVFAPQHRKTMIATLEELERVDPNSRLIAVGGQTLLHVADQNLGWVEKALGSSNKNLRREVCHQLTRAAQLGLDTGFAEATLEALRNGGGYGMTVALTAALQALAEFRSAT